ncbi:TPA: type IV toxin-antitoxin system YeeU family antitoxin [Klebsiella pneumoniae]|jgi:cytoskeleton bundling-enhancing protein CbeA-like protein|uniref:type IV toxin-antitoxin system YeeU family antitoxin n=1 Tax=Klebsiella pneumoniae TaxID=573 RepID=UPI000E2B99CF|nr:type IV toxin-antitoxin system YeeU family antitoxin [Klebsiella pneumoniae]HDT3425509.1 type IV toxin-antitoxin system YeeU family antitoxin [Klebsiella pneumoniae subsp. pneumoniae]MCD8728018.1 type IV toxin-antitoxin system YeeU family antitoxin [Klebsiella pneumoniae]MCU8730410.1 type IV toxin-antitoxin system YeeU family antitoxin [Klebsiella pneumoniae]MDS0173231.1 type IV toxin-antitoxin system YeeU family antitoxin [Klebsiella pneumoniae]WLW89465.1 type IV toxin-antitoxin system Yee
MSNPTWGLQRDITPRLGARLVQEGSQLHYLADRANIIGKFIGAECLKLDVAFPHFISQMESMLTTGEMNSHHAHCVTLYHNGFTCEADTLGSCGYTYIAIYPTQR